MIRSRSIPTVLSRVTGNGIHAVLLIDADGELLGSYGSPPPLHNNSDDDNNNGGGGGEKVPWPLDAASVGALISEVAGDYRRMGEELLLLDPQYDSQRRASSGGIEGEKDDGGQNDGDQQDQDVSSNNGEGVDGGSSSQIGGGAGGKDDKDKVPDAGTNLKSLVIELDYVSILVMY